MSAQRGNRRQERRIGGVLPRLAEPEDLARREMPQPARPAARPVDPALVLMALSVVAALGAGYFGVI